MDIAGCGNKPSTQGVYYGCDQQEFTMFQKQRTIGAGMRKTRKQGSKQETSRYRIVTDLMDISCRHH